MQPFAPFPPGRRVVAGVSGGADSMALALLLRDWGDPLAVIVDHGLRPGSAAEAALTLARLTGLGIPARVVRVDVGHGPDLGARARAARYQVLLEVCRASGRPDLLLGHHARDQDETVLLRAQSGSGPAGLAGMAGQAWRDAARLLRPLLSVAPGRLRATLEAAAVRWAEDPGNTDPATARGALRRTIVPAAAPLGRMRHGVETRLAEELAAGVTMHAAGHAEVTAALSNDAWSALIWTLSGKAYPPPSAGVRDLVARAGGTLHGVVVRGGRVFREPAALGAAVPARAGAVWDGRFVLRDGVHGAELGALLDDAGRLRRRPGWPAAVLRTLPALRLDGKLFAVPHLAYPDAATCRSVRVEFRPARPLAGAPFRP